MRAVRWHAVVTFVGYAIHASNHIRRGEHWDLLWTCNVAPVLLVIGCAIRSPVLVAIPLFWLCLGLPLWIVSLVGGSEIILTSPLVHVLALVIAVLAARRLGIPRWSWVLAIVALATLTLVCRLVTPGSLNINMAFGVYEGWEQRFPSHAMYLTYLFGVCAVGFFAVQQLIRRTR
jgi:hypothetical protein